MIILASLDRLLQKVVPKLASRVSTVATFNCDNHSYINVMY